MVDSCDSVVILIDSDECSGKSIKSAVFSCKSDAFPRHEIEGKRDDSSSNNACIDLEDSSHDDEQLSCSSASSGIPSPWKMNLASTSSGRPPSIIHTPEASIPSSDETRRAKKKSLTNNNEIIHKEDEMSCTDTSTASSFSHNSHNRDKQSDQSDGTKRQAKQQKPKKRQWGRNKKKVATASIASKSTTSNASSIGGDNDDLQKQASDECANKHFHCYLLRSLDPDHPLKTYIGFTTHPERRIRQHNGILKNGGARRTKRSGRPWTFVCVIHGFQDKITALQFEWAWQNVNKSKAFREAVGDDAVAKKMKRRYRPKARLEELRILLKDCLPFSLYSLTVYFPEQKYHDIFEAMLRKGKNGNPYKKDDDESEAYEPLTNIEVCSLENMPVAKDLAALKEKKMTKRKAGKKKEATDDSESDISEWLESAKSMVADEEHCHWSDMLDERENDTDQKSNNDDLETIAENNSSFELCDGSDISATRAHKTYPDRHDKSLQSNGVDDISNDFLSLTFDAHDGPANNQMEDVQECDLSTISSAESGCSLDNTRAKLPNIFQKENQLENQQLFGNTLHSSMADRGRRRACVQCDVVDLCDSPLKPC
eukprot:CAMPEP_0181135666 /NCGR_PEP_ID=MMETSP1071-20121207/32777_1 /TAXON_ID=35127 /ORGANISM="Thalassiosira sp., Strain NH16" /LENGTH=597 /DNA_ID=CAMNT_0023222335 /DNA_START=113 /DNA_END=1907 /DNA_ORIENTATION=+